MVSLKVRCYKESENESCFDDLLTQVLNRGETNWSSISHDIFRLVVPMMGVLPFETAFTGYMTSNLSSACPVEGTSFFTQHKVEAFGYGQLLLAAFTFYVQSDGSQKESLLLYQFQRCLHRQIFRPSLSVRSSKIPVFGI